MIDHMTLASAGELAPVGAFAVIIVWIVVGYTSSTAKARAREESRREIAAYVAEGTISPDDAVRLINAGRSANEIQRETRA
jgi:hypothetical protein